MEPGPDFYHLMSTLRSFIVSWSITDPDDRHLTYRELAAPTLIRAVEELLGGLKRGTIEPASDQIDIGPRGLTNLTKEQYSMGHGHKNKPADPVENVQPGPPPPGIPTTESTLPPQPDDLQAAHKLCGHPVRAVVGGRVMTVFLVDYDVLSGTYNGIAETCVALDTDVTGVQQRPVYGLRPYPYTERPNYAFQWVECGADESPIINIAQHNAVAAPGQSDPGSVSSGNDGGAI